MAASASRLLALKTLLVVLACVMAAAFVYGFVQDYFLSCWDPRARWMQVALLDFLINVSPITVWYFYKESRWIMRVMFMFILFWFGSATICGYILVQFSKLSPEQTLKDPFFYMLARPSHHHQNRGSTTGGGGGVCGVTTTRIIYASLGFLMLGFSVFAFLTDGSPFRAQVLSPCMITLGTDLCLQAVVYSVWIGYKESSWMNALFWILSIVCLGSIGLCGYIVRELLYLKPDQPLYLILFNRSTTNWRDEVMRISDDPLLMNNDSA